MNHQASIDLATEIRDECREDAQHDQLLGVLLEAYLLQARKAQDYQGGPVTRDDYFPLGLASFATMLNIKAKRLVSLAGNKTPQFESTRDTALDIINYAAFLVEWLDRKEREHHDNA